MKKANGLIFIAIIAAMLLSSSSYAQVDKIAQTGAKWLSIPIGARAAALGSAYTAGAPDASAVFWNPAVLALTEGGHVFLNQTKWIADINVNAISASFKVSSLGTFGVHVMAVDWGTFNGTQFTGGAELFERTGEFSTEDFVIGASFARQISNKFSFGGNLRFLHEDLGGGFEGSFGSAESFNATMDVIAFDIGTIFYTGYKDLRLGMAMQNVSQEKKYRFESFPLPLTFKFGAAMDLTQAFTDGSSDQNITLSVDATNMRDFSERVQFGLEYGFKQTVFLRGGYKFNYDEEDISLGAGLRLNKDSFALGLDYSYLQFESFDAVHMFSFDFSF